MSEKKSKRYISSYKLRHRNKPEAPKSQNKTSYAWGAVSQNLDKHQVNTKH